MRRRRFSSRRAIAALESLGYDVQKGDVVYGRREDAAVFQVWVDRGGMMRLTVTRPTGAPTAARHLLEGREYAVLREGQTLTTVRVQLASPDEIRHVLQSAERLAGDASHEEPATQPDLQDSADHEEREHGSNQR